MIDRTVQAQHLLSDSAHVIIVLSMQDVASANGFVLLRRKAPPSGGVGALDRLAQKLMALLPEELWLLAARCVGRTALYEGGPAALSLIAGENRFCARYRGSAGRMGDAGEFLLSLVELRGSDLTVRIMVMP